MWIAHFVSKVHALYHELSLSLWNRHANDIFILELTPNSPSIHRKLSTSFVGCMLTCRRGWLDSIDADFLHLYVFDEWSLRCQLYVQGSANSIAQDNAAFIVRREYNLFQIDEHRIEWNKIEICDREYCDSLNSSSGRFVIRFVFLFLLPFAYAAHSVLFAVVVRTEWWSVWLRRSFIRLFACAKLSTVCGSVVNSDALKHIIYFWLTEQYELTRFGV